MGLFRNSTQPEGEPVATFEDRLAGIGPGVPGHCPSCDGLGYVDNLDIGHRFQIQHCKDCGHRWEYLFDAEGRVVGLTELDEGGQPVARMRIRPRAAAVAGTDPTPSEAEPEPEADVEAVPDVDEVAAGDEAQVTDVIDLREPAIDLTEADQMSPAEWLRHVRR